MCGIADEQTKDFNDGYGYVCMVCRDAANAAGRQPEPEPDPEHADVHEPDPENDDEEPATKRRRL